MRIFWRKGRVALALISSPIMSTAFSTFPYTTSKVVRKSLITHGRTFVACKNRFVTPVLPPCPRMDSKLLYRVHDEQDDDTTLLRVKSRAPPGFDIKKALQESRQAPKPTSGANKPLIKALFWNQLLILTIGTVVALAALVYKDGLSVLGDIGQVFQWSGAVVSVFPWENPFLVGALGAIPALAFSNVVENSDRREFANINFSTILMVLTLFGRRSEPPEEFVPEELRGKILTTKAPEVLAESFALSTVTGLCEETVFRALLPTLMTRYLGWDPFKAMIGQATLFGLGHAQPGSSPLENGIVILLQAINGLWFGMLYYLFGGSVISSMVAHAVFDFVVFYKTWADTNAQIEYADRMYDEPLSPETEAEVKRVLASEPSKVDPRVLRFVKRLFYTFDFDKNKSLNLSEVRKGLSYLAIERKGQPPRQEQIDELFRRVVEARAHERTSRDTERLDFSDFVRLISIATVWSRAATKATA